MASSTPVCGICDSRHMYQPSEVWCPECDEGLCMDCTQHHSLSKGTKHHSTISMSEYQKLPTFVLNTSQFCKEHKERFQFYCKKDECPCCAICIVENHNNCKDVAILKDMAKNVKTSVQFNEVEQLIDELLKTVDEIRKNREKNSVDITEQKRMMESEIRDLRTKINNHLDKLQEHLMKELTEEETKITRKTCGLLSSLDEKENKLIEYQTNVVNIKQYASDLQTFLAMKQIGSGIGTHDMALHALVNSECLRQTNISCQIDTRLKNMITDIAKFGEVVVVESKPCDLSLVRRKNKQAQMMVADLQPMSIDSIQLNMKQKIKTKGKCIRGCCLLPGGRMVFSDYQKDTVSFINKDGVELFHIGKDKTKSDAYDALYMKDNNSVAVSSGYAGNRCIAIIDVESQNVMTTISMDTDVYGMAVRGRTMYYCTHGDEIMMLNLSDTSVSYIINSDMPNVKYVATFGDKLYYTNWNTDTVTCCDIHGTTEWTFNDTRVLTSPYGISVDNDGNVYVVGFVNNNLVVISPDGQRHRQLLSGEDGLKHPRVLDYDRSTNRLLVVNEERTAFLFDVTRGE